MRKIKEMKYAKALKRVKDKKVDKLFKKYALKASNNFPEWYVTYEFTKERVHKRGCIIAEHHTVNMINKYNFEFDMRDNWKRTIRMAYERVIEYIERSTR